MRMVWNIMIWNWGIIPGDWRVCFCMVNHRLAFLLQCNGTVHKCPYLESVTLEFLMVAGISPKNFTLTNGLELFFGEGQFSSSSQVLRWCLLPNPNSISFSAYNSFRIVISLCCILISWPSAMLYWLIRTTLLIEIPCSSASLTRFFFVLIGYRQSGEPAVFIQYVLIQPVHFYVLTDDIQCRRRARIPLTWGILLPLHRSSSPRYHYINPRGPRWNNVTTDKNLIGVMLEPSFRRVYLYYCSRELVVGVIFCKDSAGWVLLYHRLSRYLFTFLLLTLFSSIYSTIFRNFSAHYEEQAVFMVCWGGLFLCRK